MVEYFTRPYFDELATRLNDDGEFQSKAANLNVSLLNVAKDKDRAFLMRIEGGRVAIEDAASDASADFVFVGDYDTWVSNHKEGVTLEKLIMTGKIKFKGSIPRVMMMKNNLTIVDQKAREIDVTY